MCTYEVTFFSLNELLFRLCYGFGLASPTLRGWLPPGAALRSAYAPLRRTGSGTAPDVIFSPTFFPHPSILPPQADYSGCYQVAKNSVGAPLLKTDRFGFLTVAQPRRRREGPLSPPTVPFDQNASFYRHPPRCNRCYVRLRKLLRPSNILVEPLQRLLIQRIDWSARLLHCRSADRGPF